MRLACTQELRTAQSSTSEDEEEESTIGPGILIVQPTLDGDEKISQPIALPRPSYCTRCMVKDSEIHKLRKRVEALEEQLCRALKS